MDFHLYSLQKTIPEFLSRNCYPQANEIRPSPSIPSIIETVYRTIKLCLSAMKSINVSRQRGSILLT